MRHDAKAVPIHKDSRQIQASVLPPAIMDVRDSSLQQLQKRLQVLFTVADDILFEMADRATSNSEQNALFAAMRDLRLKRKQLERDFLHNLVEHFSQLGQPADRRQQEPGHTAPDTAENIELEESLALEAAASQIISQHEPALVQLCARFSHVLQHPVSLQENPLGAKKLPAAFLHACTFLGFDTHIKLVVFQLFEQSVLASLGDIYASANKLLIHAGALPELDASAPPTSSAADSSNQPAETSGHTDSHHEPEQIHFDELQTLLAPLKSNDAGTAVPADAAPISTNDLIRLLSHLQQHNAQKLVNSETLHNQLDSILRRVSKQNQRTPVVGEMDRDIINLVSMLFDFILDDRSIPDKLKALIGRMQIPLLKVAVLDTTFFDNPNHPAKRLLNQIGTAALGWNEQDTTHRDNLYQKIENIVQRIQHDFTDEPEAFNDILTDFTRFMRAEQHRSQLLEQRILDAEEDRARSEQARHQVEQVLNQCLLGKTLPEVVINILQDSWSKVMLLNHLKFGGDSRQWQHCIQVMEQLVWSVQPAQSPDSLTTLQSLLPGLLENLQAGFTQAELDPFACALLFTRLEVSHVQALQQARVVYDNSIASRQKPTTRQLDNSRQTPPAQPQPEPRRSEPVAPTADMVEVKARIALSEQPASTAPVEVAVNHPSLRIVDSLRAGSWFELTGADGQSSRCKLAAIIKTTGRYIFVNRRGLKVLEQTRAELAQAFSQGTLSLLDDAQLFDRALESVIGDLRRIKKHG